MLFVLVWFLGGGGLKHSYVSIFIVVSSVILAPVRIKKKSFEGRCTVVHRETTRLGPVRTTDCRLIYMIYYLQYGDGRAGGVVKR